MEKEFLVANSVKEAVLQKDCKSIYYAGGTEINRLNSGLSDKSLISIKKLGLNAIENVDNSIKIGATTTFQEIIDSNITPSYLKKACMFMASRTKRNMATIGGNIALRRTDSYLIPTLVVANAKLLLQNKLNSVESVDLIDYVESNKEYVDSLIISVILPKEIFVKSKRCANTVLSHAYVTVAVSQYDGKYSIFAGLKNSGFAKLSTVVTIVNKKKNVTLNDILELVKTTNEIHFYDDIYGSVEYKKYILGVAIYELYSSIKGDDK